MAPSNNHFAAIRAKKRKADAANPKPKADPTAAVVARAEPKPLRKKEQRVGNLDWKNIVLPSEFGFDEDGGLLELDEVEGVDVVYADGKVSFQVREQDEEDGAIKPPKAKKQKKSKALPVVEEDESPFPAEDLSVFETEEQLEEPAAEEESVLEETKEEPAAPAPEKKAKKAKGKKRAEETPVAAPEAVEEDFDVERDLPNWSTFPLASPLYRALAELKFDKPTAIQERSLSVEIGATPFVEPPYVSKPEDEAEEEAEEEWGGIAEDDSAATAATTSAEPYVSVFPEEPAPSTEPISTDRDVVGVAQTGSGKTLAYGLPILSYILSHPPTPSTVGEPVTRLAALILAPTRELALQVRAAISEVAIRTNALLPDELQDPNKNAPRKRVRGQHVSVVALTGGMSVEKQKRQLSRGADILVATPGRLWDLIGEDDSLARQIKNIKFLVIDEADRMIENGHFAELESIVRLTRRKGEEDEEDEYVDDFTTAVSSASKVDTLESRPDMRTFVFSATMSKDLQRNLKKRGRRYKPGQPEDGMSSLDDLLLKLDFRDPDPEIIDLSPEGGLVDTLKECKVECMLPEKDVHLYHFLLRYPGRTIVFLSSIDGIRRLHPLLVLLGLNIVQLHSGMQQRARLKSLDRFKSSDNAILLATDVAARGLDIPSVSHVVHYQLPRSADVYVHRSGRTARAGKEGLALQLVAPEEKQMQRLLMASLGKDVDLPELPADYSILDALKQRIELAKKIESGQHKATKEAHDDNWLRQAAEAMEIDVDSDMDLSDGENSGNKNSRKKKKSKQANVTRMRAELQALLDKPLMMRGISGKYITTRGRVGFVDQLVEGTGHSTILGIEASTALEDLPKAKKRPSKK
ncbi:P-loop containing nucleoside triphosphate hydrolase protein [Leucosporidium creatinivorum]|uniref:ATP-dependent RNA helicase n=1 Tax=Leucosporidium creatinivorum TaxID=106004 RepID=A0A1Y2EM35_9BASI|nr:P-loop containing nucleoside triphosphate hydrolase protein [Leucosporidium creatinivorum]